MWASHIFQTIFSVPDFTDNKASILNSICLSFIKCFIHYINKHKIWKQIGISITLKAPFHCRHYFKPLLRTELVNASKEVGVSGEEVTTSPPGDCVSWYQRFTHMWNTSCFPRLLNLYFL